MEYDQDRIKEGFKRLAEEARLREHRDMYGRIPEQVDFLNQEETKSAGT